MISLWPRESLQLYSKTFTCPLPGISFYVDYDEVMHNTYRGFVYNRTIFMAILSTELTSKFWWCLNWYSPKTKITPDGEEKPFTDLWLGLKKINIEHTDRDSEALPWNRGGNPVVIIRFKLKSVYNWLIFDNWPLSQEQKEQEEGRRRMFIFGTQIKPYVILGNNWIVHCPVKS